MTILNHRIGVIFMALVIIFLSFASLSFAEKVTFVKEYTYQASELDSKASCRTISLEMVKRLLLEELGTYLISETEVKDFKLTKEQVKTYSAGIVGAEIIDDKWDGKTYWLKAKVSADPKEAAKLLKKIMDDQFKVKELEETRKKAEELTKEVERLNKELAKATNKQPSKKNQQEYKAAIQGLTAIEWFNKGYEAGMAGREQEALEAFTNAIELSPDDAEAYFRRGVAYLNSGNSQQAINDFSKAIDLNLDFGSVVYMFRGLAFDRLGNYQKAIKDYTKTIELAIKEIAKAIELHPDSASAGLAALAGLYGLRGLSYGDLGNNQQAIKDFTKAIELKPDYDSAYYNKGVVYYKLGNYQQAINDMQIAARLGYKPAQDFLINMGIQW
ncbi:MAG: tetratricopeptide repeat protein [Nitrospirae bacterium]|nr:tetratricopeptide repeat protein [Nitrospirota bacterium]